MQVGGWGDWVVGRREGMPGLKLPGRVYKGSMVIWGGGVRGGGKMGRTSFVEKLPGTV